MTEGEGRGGQTGGGRKAVSDGGEGGRGRGGEALTGSTTPGLDYANGTAVVKSQGQIHSAQGKRPTPRRPSGRQSILRPLVATVPQPLAGLEPRNLQNLSDHFARTEVAVELLGDEGKQRTALRGRRDGGGGGGG